MDEHQEESVAPSKRRRKVKANADKRFECNSEGCGKSYSRAEHLYRHQLNHKPKQIYHCSHPGCVRTFFRQDLCVRHQERHSSQGSQLQKRDASSRVAAPVDGRDSSSSTPGKRRGSSGVLVSTVDTSSVTSRDHILTVADPKTKPSRRPRGSDSMASTSSTSVESRYQPHNPHAMFPGSVLSDRHTTSPTSYNMSPEQHKQVLASSYPGAERRTFSTGQDPPYGGAAVSPTLYRHDSGASSHFPLPMNSQAPSLPIVSSFGAESALRISAPSGFSHTGPDQTSNASIATAVANGLGVYEAMSAAPYAVSGDGAAVDISAGFTYPIFGGGEYERSPVARGAEMVAWLFNEHQQTISSDQQAISGYTPASNVIPGYVDIGATQIQAPIYSDHFNNYYSPNVQPQHPMSVMSILDSTTSPRSIMFISEDKRQEILDLMASQFIERPQDAVKNCKDGIFDGDLNSDRHVLSLTMLQLYIESYFTHQHTQLPILHKPTFSADKTPNLLLLTIMAIGAATLERGYGALTDAAVTLANFIAWHVRWEIVRDEGYRPPAKLWVFQTLILLEIYEKMYSTRALHERAHINHDTTLTLMRRGTSFIGRAANDSPGSLRDGKTARSSGSNSASDAVASEESWSHWIRNEATRRIAFAAFVIDSIHATMFGHSPKMVAYEIRLPLPCDEALWSATSAAEVARVQATHQTNGIKPIMFLDGLKKTLYGTKVRTNSFGRTILMCGLLSVNSLLNQRDLQISALGAQHVQISGLSSKWRGTLLRAFDNWKKDFDEALAEAYPTNNHNNTTSPISSSSAAPPFTLRHHIDDDNLFESRTVLHHLAHMASCVDIIDCQTFAGARRLLGRPIGMKEYSHVRDKMINTWAPTRQARGAAFYALKFLVQVLVTGAGGGVTILPHAFDDQNRYLARDDFLLNRPWVLYFSALVVWCYGFAVDGALNPPPSSIEPIFATPQQALADMRQFLDRVGGVSSPEELEHITGRNRCLGLLEVLKDSFRITRWELTHEATGLLGNCVGKLVGKMSDYYF